MLGDTAKKLKWTCNSSGKASNSAGKLPSLGALAPSAHSDVRLQKNSSPSHTTVILLDVRGLALPRPLLRDREKNLGVGLDRARSLWWLTDTNAVGNQHGRHHQAVRSKLTLEVATRAFYEEDRPRRIACRSERRLRKAATLSCKAIGNPGVSKAE